MKEVYSLVHKVTKYSPERVREIMKNAGLTRNNTPALICSVCFSVYLLGQIDIPETTVYKLLGQHATKDLEDYVFMNNHNWIVHDNRLIRFLQFDWYYADGREIEKGDNPFAVPSIISYLVNPNAVYRRHVKKMTAADGTLGKTRIRPGD